MFQLKWKAISLNVTGSFADDIIRVVCVRHRLYGWLLTKNVLEIIRHHINMNKIYFFHFTPGKFIISCNNIFDTNILSRGYPTKLIPGGGGGGGVDKHPLVWRFQGGAGLKQKSPLWGVGGMDIFWNYTSFSMGSIWSSKNCKFRK